MSDYDKSIHSNRDALAWAKFFIKTKNENNSIIDERLMHSWFASAMMAMHDSIYNQEIGLLQSRIKELEGAVSELGEGLEFYSDIENHAVIFHVGEGKLATTDKHSGKKAREIITKHKDLIESITKDER